MEEKTSGKRVAQPTDGGKSARRGPIIALALVAVLVAAYFGLCGWASASNAILPRTTADGVDISRLSGSQARDTLQAALSSRYSGMSLPFQVAGSGEHYSISGTAVTADIDAALQQAGLQNQAPFPLRGWRLLSALLLGNDIAVPVVFTPEGEQQVTAYLADITATLSGQVAETTWAVEDDELVFYIGVPGIGFDTAALKADILARFSAGDFSTLQVSTETTDPLPPDMDAVHAQVYTEVKDASLHPETFEITPSVTGLDFRPDTARAAIDGAAWGARVPVPLMVTEPSITTESLQELLFRDVLGQATSKVSGSAARRSNVALAAAAFNGKILLPGEVFSYNNTTGSRTADKGYQSAPVYKDGKSVDEVGGGICQPSSTLYLATLNSNLKIVERHHHQFAVGYVPDGMDATVYYGSLDYRFENDTAYPLKLVSESYKSGGATYLTVTIYGTKTDSYTVEMTNNVYNWVSYGTQYEIDPSVPVGTVKEAQNGYNGRNAEAYRNVYDGNGNLVSSTLETTNRYKSRDRILLVNPADAGKYGLATDGTALPPTTPAESPSAPPAQETPPASDTPIISPIPMDPPAEPTPSPTPSPDPVASEEPVPSFTPDPGLPEAPPDAPDDEAPPAGIPILRGSLQSGGPL